MDTDTYTGTHDSDTCDLSLSLGDRVVVTAGGLNGVEGAVVAFRADARILVELGHGFYIEISRFCIRKVY